jgi:hypothetical protein
MRTFKNKDLWKKRLKKTYVEKSVRETYEWWREQETNEYEVDTDYFYTPTSRMSSDMLNDISSLDRPDPDSYIWQ